MNFLFKKIVKLLYLPSELLNLNLFLFYFYKKKITH